MKRCIEESRKEGVAHTIPLPIRRNLSQRKTPLLSGRKIGSTTVLSFETQDQACHSET
jgi:hypothetical protein